MLDSWNSIPGKKMDFMGFFDSKETVRKKPNDSKSELHMSTGLTRVNQPESYGKWLGGPPKKPYVQLRNVWKVFWKTLPSRKVNDIVMPF